MLVDHFRGFRIDEQLIEYAPIIQSLVRPHVVDQKGEKENITCCEFVSLDSSALTENSRFEITACKVIIARKRYICQLRTSFHVTVLLGEQSEENIFGVSTANEQTFCWDCRWKILSQRSGRGIGQRIEVKERCAIDGVQHRHFHEYRRLLRIEGKTRRRVPLVVIETTIMEDGQFSGGDFAGLLLLPALLRRLFVGAG